MRCLICNLSLYIEGETLKVRFSIIIKNSNHNESDHIQNDNFVYSEEVLFSTTSTSSALENALQKFTPPMSVISDNGKDFTGKDFLDVLQKYGVKLHTISPYTPEENGKVERFWRTIEQSKPKNKSFRGEYLDLIINKYNTQWYHYGLKEITGLNMTPEHAWKTMEHYNGQLDACFIKY